MIKANELRVGNHVSLNGKQVIVKDIPYLIDDNKEGYLINEVWADEYEPILLTNGILEKCGFVLDKSGDFCTINDLISFSIDESKNITQTWIYTDKKFRAINYLHELQNLYYALTGKELNIELNAQVSDTTEA